MIYTRSNKLPPSESINPAKLVPVGFVCQSEEPKDQEIYNMIDEVIEQILGPQGLSAIIKPGDKVVIKVNNIGPSIGKRGEKGRGVITDPRIVRYVAEKVREIIGFSGTADLKVVGSTFYADSNPSLKSRKTSFYWARLERSGDNVVDDNDFCYDSNGNGLLDGSSYARLINLDSLDITRRQTMKINVSCSEAVTVCLPKLLRTREEANGSDDYCDILIGLPVFKSHIFTGITGALKLHYGFRPRESIDGDTGRWGHSGLYMDNSGIHCKQNLINYLCAEHLVRTYDLVIMDCLTGNRRGPQNINPGLLSDDDDEPVDYILSNALMASTDSVAIDTVETALAGYEPKSIGLLETANVNHVGTNSPQKINILGLDKFSKHRKRLYERYHSQNLYPFEEGWGDAHITETINSAFIVNIDDPTHVNEGIYALKYTTQASTGVLPDLARAELWINGEMITCQVDGTLEQGEFIFDIKRFPENSYLLCFIAVWDQIFNCALSPEIVFKP